jgi:CHAD domain-containing protein
VRSKSERGEQLAAGRTVGPPQSAARVELGAAPDADAAVRAMLGGALSQALANAAPVAAGEHEAEHLHQLRVALRRLRNLLRVFARAGSGSDEAAGDGAGDADADLVERLSQVYSRLGASRDRDVAMVTLWPALLAAGAPRVEWPVDDDPTAAPPAVLSEPAVQQLWLDLLRRVWLVPPATEVPAEPAADEPPDAPHEPHEHAGADTAMTTSAATSDATDAVAAALAPALAALQRSLRREATSFADLNDAGRHRLRRRLKRLSDAAELSQPLWPQRALRRLLRRLRRAQSALGEFSDTVMAIDRYRSLASVDPSAWFAVGWLSARRQTLLAPCEQALQHFAALRPRWRP